MLRSILSKWFAYAAILVIAVAIYRANNSSIPTVIAAGWAILNGAADALIHIWEQAAGPISGNKHP